MSSDIGNLRKQILANAKYLMFAKVKKDEATPKDETADKKDETTESGSKLPALSSVMTLVTPTPATTGTPGVGADDLEIVVFGDGTQFTAAVMCGIYPVVEGAEAPNPETAMRKLLLATSEYLNTMMPKVGSHQRNIHGGGVIDEDFVSDDLLNKKV